jgi:phospholipid transport system transporter-binding protein
MAEFVVESMQKVFLRGRVDDQREDCALASAREFFDGLTRGHELEIDLCALESAHSIALSLLLCILRLAERKGCTVSFSGLSHDMFDVARVGGLDAILPQKRS